MAEQKPDASAPGDRRPAPPRRRTMTAVGSLTPRIAGRSFARRGFDEPALLARWDQVVGDWLAGFTVPERLVRGDLTVRVGSGALAPELQHLAPQLIERINGFFGYAAVTRLRVVQGPVPRRPAVAPPPPPPLDPEQEAALATRLAPIEDGDLRESLARLGRVLAARTRGS